MGQVTTEKLIRTVARQGHLDMPMDEDAEEKGGNGPGKGFIKSCQHLGQAFGEFLGRKQVFMVFGGQALGHQAGKFNILRFPDKLALRLFVIPETEGDYRLGLVAAHQSHHRTGIYSP